MKVTAEQKQVLAENAVTGQGLPSYGTQVLMNVINEMGALPTRNMREVQFEGADKISGEAMHEPRESDGKPNLVTNAAHTIAAKAEASPGDKGTIRIAGEPHDHLTPRSALELGVSTIYQDAEQHGALGNEVAGNGCRFDAKSLQRNVQRHHSQGVPGMLEVQALIRHLLHFAVGEAAYRG